MKALDVLSQARLFKTLSNPHREALATVASPSTLGAGDSLVKQGTKDRNIYVLASGSVKVLKGSEEVARFGCGATLGEMAFVDGEERSTSVEAVERTDVLRMDAERLDGLLSGDVALGAAFYKAISSALTRRLRGATEDVATLRAVLKSH